MEIFSGKDSMKKLKKIIGMKVCYIQLQILLFSTIFFLFCHNLFAVTCGRKTLEDDDYYCDKQLVQRLIFDARNTYTSYNKKFQFKVNNDSFLFYNPSLRFVATMSGLTRWEYISDQPNLTTDSKSKKK